VKRGLLRALRGARLLLHRSVASDDPLDDEPRPGFHPRGRSPPWSQRARRRGLHPACRAPVEGRRRRTPRRRARSSRPPGWQERRCSPLSGRKETRHRECTAYRAPKGAAPGSDPGHSAGQGRRLAAPAGARSGRSGQAVTAPGQAVTAPGLAVIAPGSAVTARPPGTTRPARSRAGSGDRGRRCGS